MSFSTCGHAARCDNYTGISSVGSVGQMASMQGRCGQRRNHEVLESEFVRTHSIAGINPQYLRFV